MSESNDDGPGARVFLALLRASPAILAGGLALIFVIGMFFANCVEEKHDYWGNIPVFTDDVVATDQPDSCLDYTNRGVRIQDEAGVEVWTGVTELGGVIKQPALGCRIDFFTPELPSAKRLTVTIDGLGSNTYRVEDLNDSYDIIVWPSICLDDPTPCDLTRDTGS